MPDHIEELTPTQVMRDIFNYAANKRMFHELDIHFHRLFAEWPWIQV